MTVSHRTVDSPLGPLTLAATGDGICGLYLSGQRYHPPVETFGPHEADLRPDAVAQLAAYFAGELRRFTLPLDLAGTPFQQRVWAALQQIPYGETRTYAQVAVGLGRAPGAAPRSPTQ